MFKAKDKESMEKETTTAVYSWLETKSFSFFPNKGWGERDSKDKYIFTHHHPQLSILDLVAHFKHYKCSKI